MSCQHDHRIACLHLWKSSYVDESDTDTPTIFAQYHYISKVVSQTIVDKKFPKLMASFLLKKLKIMLQKLVKSRLHGCFNSMSDQCYHFSDNWYSLAL